MQSGPDNGQPDQPSGIPRLDEYRDFNAAILSSAGALVLVTDSASRIIRFNPACENASGCSEAEICGDVLLDLPLLQCDLECWRAAFAETRRRGRAGPLELNWCRPDGEESIVRWSFRGLRNVAGELTHVVASGIDITESRAAYAALQETSRRYRLLVENLHEGLWLTDAANRTTYVNEQMASMLGYGVDEMIGRPAFEFMDAEGVAIAERHLERRKDGIPENYEFALIGKDGDRVHTIMQASPVTDRKGRYRGVLHGVLDIRDRKRQEQELRAARDDLERRVDERTQELRDALDEVRRLKDRLEAENVFLREEVKKVRPGVTIIGSCPAIRASIEQARRVALTESSVMLIGETGTGKGLFAEAIHAWSPLADRPLVTVDCGALTPTLIESELFGHERGAFTGAVRDRPGRFEMADGATLFLDEIGNMPIDLQARLLRVLQSGEFERVGSARTRQVHTRVIAATNRNLQEMVDRHQFRADLFYRLSVFPIAIPPLRERRDDIPGLVRYFVRQLSGGRDPEVEVPSQVLDVLQRHRWPGNVRELSNTIERALITSGGRRLVLDDVLASIDAFSGYPQEGRRGAKPGSLRDLERRHILKTLDRCGWRIKGAGNAAERLGLPASTLRDRMKKLQIARPRAGDVKKMRRRPPSAKPLL